jgi:signal transduction histidine kinase
VFRSVSRLTLVFTLAFIVSGSILTYFSINNISNFQELTEKKILEEENELSNRVRDTIQKRIEDLTAEFTGNILAGKPGRDHLMEFAGIHAYCSFPFIVSYNGEFIYPNFVRTLRNITEPTFSKAYNYYFTRGEKAEFHDKNHKSAKKYYLSCLKQSAQGSDSVKSLNALGRLLMKDQKPENAIGFYSTVLRSYPAHLDANGYPYSYYAISQLIKIDDSAAMNSVLSLIEHWLEKMNTGSVLLNFSTEELLDGILQWIAERLFEDRNKLQNVYDLVQKIQLQLQFVNQYGRTIEKFILEEHKNRSRTNINGFEVVDYFSDEKNNLILVNTGLEDPAGFVIHKERFFDSILNEKIPDGFEFDYAIEIVANDNGISSNYVQGHSSQLDPFFPGSTLRIKLKHEDLLRDYVTKRSWIYGVALVLLLVGMSLGIVLILRDIAREKQMVALRSDFVSNVTHELKTPLTSIYMFAESMFLDRVRSRADRKEYLSVIIKESERLKRMINNILDFSKMEEKKQKYSFVDTDLSLLMRTILDEMNYWFEEKKIKVISEIDPSVHATVDPEKIKQVFSNLISNAIKYSPDGTKIFIRLHRNSDHPMIEIKDRGMGIPEDQLPHIFEKFYRVRRKETEGISGTGLGLTVVKEIIDAHQGKIVVESKEGEGSKFTIIL